LSGSEVNSWPEIMYNRTTNYLRESAVKTAMEDVNKKREG